MSFTSVEFLILVFVGLVLYYAKPGKAQPYILLVISLAFYAFLGIYCCSFLLATCLITYLVANALDKLKNKMDKKIVLSILSIVLIGGLFTVKYSNDLGLNLILPMGLSFYILQSFGYVIDVYRKKERAEKNFLKHCLFVSFFPQMVQGPISRFGQLAPMLFKEHKFNSKMFKYGIEVCLLGYIKKLVVADRAAIVVSEIFTNYLNYDGAASLFGILLYAVQIYFDFSGGIDITRGIAYLFGIELTDNFKRPVFANSLENYWKRWHISLGTWMKDYVFYPIILSKPYVKFNGFIRRHFSGRYGKAIGPAVATLIVYFLVGFWHGIGPKFVAFGLWNGLIIGFSSVFASKYISLKNKLGYEEHEFAWNVFAIIRTNILVLVGKTFSRAEGLKAALVMMKRIAFKFNFAQLKNSYLSLGLEKIDYALIFLGCIVLFLIELYQEKKGSFAARLDSKPVFVQWLWMFVPLCALLVFGIARGSYISSEFIYKAF